MHTQTNIPLARLKPQSMPDLSALKRPWTTQEAADFLQIHPRTITRMAKSGELPAFRIGTHWRFRPSDLDDWMRSKVSCTQLNPVRDN